MIIHDRQIKKFFQRTAAGSLIITCVFGGELIYQNHFKNDLQRRNVEKNIGLTSKTMQKGTKGLSAGKEKEK